MGIVIAGLAALCAVGLLATVVMRRHTKARGAGVATRDGSSAPVADVLEPYHRGESGQLKMPVSVAVRMRALREDPDPGQVAT